MQEASRLTAAPEESQRQFYARLEDLEQAHQRLFETIRELRGRLEAFMPPQVADPVGG